MSQEQEQKIEPVKVLLMGDIDAVIENFKPNSDAHVRKLLMDGLSDIKKRSIIVDSYNSTVNDEDFGGYPPVNPDNIMSGFHWVDKLVKERMDAKIINLDIVWDLKDGKHVFNPYTGDVRYNVNDSGSDGIKTASDVEAETS